MSETVTETPVQSDAPPAHGPSESLSQQADDDATKPLEYGNGQEAKPEESEDKPPEKSADELRKDERRREAQRIAHLTKNRYAQQARAEAAERRAQELEQRLRAYEAPAQGQQQPTAADIDRLTQERAQQLVAEQERVKRVNDWDAAGKQAHGEQEFAKACQTVADMADDAQRRTLLAVAMDVEGAQGAILKMAGDADLAEKILSLPPHRMALELEKLADKPEAAKPTKPATTLGAPIKPPTIGHAKTLPDPNGSWDQFQRWSATVNWKR